MRWFIPGLLWLASAGLATAEDAPAELLRLKENWQKVPSKVVGSPEPPLPYRAVRAWPELKLTFPLFVIREPGTDNLLFLDQQSSSGPTRLCRTADPASGKFEPLLDMPNKGLAYSVEFHPDYARNGYLYVGYNSANEGGEKRCRVTRWTVAREAPFALDPKSELEIIAWDSNGHNGLALAFGLDGKLFVTTGDGTSDSDTNLTGQGLDHLLAKVLRIDVDNVKEGQTYSVPADNPFVGQKHKGKEIRPETWAYGFRNPWRMTCDPRQGHLWVGNNGQDLWEQVFLVKKGANYGWSVYEGGHIFYAERELGPTPHSPPQFDHPHSESRSLTGGVVYYGAKHPDLHGAYFYGDYSTGKIWAGKMEGDQLAWHKEVADTTLSIAGFGLDAAGELLIVDHQGKEQGGFYRLEPNPVPETPVAFPRKLSETGLFASVKDHQLHPGVIPYDVNSSFWSDGAYKTRAMVLPATMEKNGEQVPTSFGLGGNGSWDLPNHTVLVKSFALEREEGKPETRRWIETRLMTRQDNEWVGYSYIWNDEQTDAELVAKEGTKKTYVIRTAAGERRQTWSYPSRSDCMVCHSRAAKFVLGPSTAQLNRSIRYGETEAHQLQVLKWLGLLQADWKAEARRNLQAEWTRVGKPGAEINAELNQWLKDHEAELAQAATSLTLTPPGVAKLPDPYDEQADLNGRARSWLHVNCAQCHVEAGGGNAQMTLRYSTAADKLNIFNVDPLHHKFGLIDPKLVAPGHPERSILLHRVSHRDKGHMPPLATGVVDEQAVKLLRDWIASLPQE